MTHFRSCEKKDPSDQVKISDFAHGSSYDKGKMRFLLALWVSRHHRPFAIIEDKELQDIFRMLYARVDIPSRKTLSRDVNETFAMAKVHVAQVLKVENTRLISLHSSFAYMLPGVSWPPTYCC